MIEEFETLSEIEVCLSFLEESFTRFIELIDGWDYDDKYLRSRYIEYVVQHQDKLSKTISTLDKID